VDFQTQTLIAICRTMSFCLASIPLKTPSTLDSLDLETECQLSRPPDAAGFMNSTGGKIGL